MNAYTPNAVRNSREAEALGADGLMILPPYYYTPTEDEIFGYYRAICEAVSLPIMLYNNPVTSNVDMSAKLVGRLTRSFENIRYIKEASLDVGRVFDVIEETDGVMNVFAGERIVESFTLGAVGYVNPYGNYIPRASYRIWDYLVEGRIEDANKVQRADQRDGSHHRRGPPDLRAPVLLEGARRRGRPPRRRRPPAPDDVRVAAGRGARRIAKLVPLMHELDALVDRARRRGRCASGAGPSRSAHPRGRASPRPAGSCVRSSGATARASSTSTGSRRRRRAASSAGTGAEDHRRGADPQPGRRRPGRAGAQRDRAACARARRAAPAGHAGPLQVERRPGDLARGEGVLLVRHWWPNRRIATARVSVRRNPATCPQPVHAADERWPRIVRRVHRYFAIPPIARYLISRNSSIPWCEPSRPMPRLLDAAERRALVREDARVDADDAELERLADPPDAARCRAAKKYAASPNSVSFASAIASSSVEKRKIGASGPNVSSRAMRMSGVAPVSTVGSKNVPPSACRLPPVVTVAPLRERVGDVLLDLRDAGLVDQRALARRRRRSRCPMRQRGDRGRELLDERVVDRRPARGCRFAQTQVWPVLRNFEAIAPSTASVEVGVVEHDQRRVAAELERDLLDRAGALAPSAACRPRSSR